MISTNRHSLFVWSDPPSRAGLSAGMPGQNAASVKRGISYRALLALLLLSSFVVADELKAGRNAKLPAGNTAYTWDCYLPKAYFANPQERFPVMYLSSPGGDPTAWNNYGIEPWAERRSIIIIGINDSSNAAGLKVIRAAQAAVVRASDEKLRLHPALRYAMGTSGGGACSILLIESAPERFAGVFVNVHTAGPPAKHVACVYVGGEADTVIPIDLVRAAAEKAKSNGNPVRFVADPGNHDLAWLRGKDAEPYLDWLLFSTCISHPRLTPADITAGKARLSAELTEVAAVADPAELLTRCETLLEIPAFLADKQVAVSLGKMWTKVALDTANAGGDPIATHKLLLRVAEHPQFPRIDPNDSKVLLAELKELRNTDPVKSEWAALQSFRKVEASEKKAGTAKKALRGVATSYLSIFKKFPETEAGKLAEVAAKRIAANLNLK